MSTTTGEAGYGLTMMDKRSVDGGRGVVDGERSVEAGASGRRVEDEASGRRVEAGASGR